MPEMTREQHIIFKLIRGEKIDSLDGIDVNNLIDLVRRHRLFPVSESTLKLMKEPERSDLKQRIQNWSIKSLHLASVLAEIFKEFSNNDLDAIALKGPVLSAALYGEVVKRSYNDLDILVGRENLWKSIEVLKDLGFRLQYPRENLSARQWKYYFRYKKEVGLVHKTQKSYIELHVGIYIHELLRRSEEFLLLDETVEETIYDASLETLNRENTFLYLLYHGAYHMYKRLFWLRDVAQALKSWKLDHKAILNKARQLGIERLLGVSLILSRHYLGSTVPEAYSDYLYNDRIILKKLFRLCRKRILGRENEIIFDKMRRNRYFSLLKPGLTYRWTVFKSLFHRWYIRKFLGGH